MIFATIGTVGQPQPKPNGWADEVVLVSQGTSHPPNQPANHYLLWICYMLTPRDWVRVGLGFQPPTQPQHQPNLNPIPRSQHIAKSKVFGVWRCVLTYVGVVGKPKENSSVALLANLLEFKQVLVPSEAAINNAFLFCIVSLEL